VLLGINRDNGVAFARHPAVVRIFLVIRAYHIKKVGIIHIQHRRLDKVSTVEFYRHLVVHAFRDHFYNEWVLGQNLAVV
jgi:hypothetical protein